MTRRYEFKPVDGSEIQSGYSLAGLVLRVAEPEALTNAEVERIVLADVGAVIYIKDVGEFRRIR